MSLIDGQEKVLIVGGDSGIGRALVDFFELDGAKVWKTVRRFCGSYARCLELDLSEDIEGWELPEEGIGFAVICAAITSIQKCHDDLPLSQKVNVTNTLVLVEKLLSAGVFVIFLSSDAVFDGEFPLAGVDDTPNPQTEYGKQKFEVEQRLLSVGGDSVVIRLGKIVVPMMGLFKGWVDDLRKGVEVHPFSNMFFSPVSLEHAVAVINFVARNRVKGIVHATAPCEISYAEAAYFIAEKIGVNSVLVKPISCQDGNGVQFVPRHTALGGHRFCQDVGSMGLEALLSLNCLVGDAVYGSS